MRELFSRPALTFLAIAFGFSYSVAGALYLVGGFEGAGPFATLFLLISMFGPAIAALICVWLFDKGGRMDALGLKIPSFKTLLKWIPFAWLVPIVLAGGGVIVAILFSGQPAANPITVFSDAISALGATEDLPMSIETLFWLQMGIGVPVGILINSVILTISEELGWRGWLQPRLKDMGFWPMCLAIGLIWGLWHAPIILMGFNYPGMGWGGVAMMCVFTTLLTPYLALLRERGAGAWGAGAFHGSINAVTGASFMFLSNAAWPWNGLLGIGGVVVMVTGCILIALYRRACPAI